MAKRSPSRRFLVLGGPGGRLNCLAPGDPGLTDLYRPPRWVVLFAVNRPLTHALADVAKGEALRCYELAPEPAQGGCGGRIRIREDPSPIRPESPRGGGAQP
jgi:hypothetical protein